MWKSLTGMLFVSIVASAAPVPEPPAVPTGLVPRFVVVQVIDGNYVFTEQKLKPVTKVRVEEVVVENKKVQRSVAYVDYVSETVKYIVNGSAIRVYDTDGKIVPPADAAMRLKDPIVVVRAADDKVIDPAYRAALSRKTLIVVLSTEAKGPAVTPPNPSTMPPDRFPPPPSPETEPK